MTLQRGRDGVEHLGPHGRFDVVGERPAGPDGEQALGRAGGRGTAAGGEVHEVRGHVDVGPSRPGQQRVDDGPVEEGEGTGVDRRGERRQAVAGQHPDGHGQRDLEER